MIFASLAYYGLEKHFNVELFYELACIMEREKLTEISIDGLRLICGSVVIESRFGGTARTNYNMIKERLNVLESLFIKSTDEADYNSLKERIKETIVLVTNYSELVTLSQGGLLKDAFREKTSIEDRASFLRYYNIFSCWKKKEWTRKRIQNMRKLYELIKNE